MKGVFEVDTEGLKAIQLRKPKYHVVRELIQNAWDENITRCSIWFMYYRGTATIVVEDDSPVGFRDLKDAYTLFGNCYKRPDPEKRGRFNVGEKQVFSICQSAMIQTTTGTIIFDKTGRHRKRDKTKRGTRVEVKVRMTKDEYKEMEKFVSLMIFPRNINFVINEESVVPHKYKYRTRAKLSTEFLKNGVMRKTARTTNIFLYDILNTFESRLEQGQAYLYEMGIPVCPIDGNFSVDVNQRIPMGIDRDTVSNAYLQDIYAIVLNETHDELKPSESSENWVRIGMSDDRVETKAVKTVVEKRFGDKVVVATPGDRNSIDEAISNGYNVVYGSELSKDEWTNVRRDDIIPSSSDVFGRGVVPSKSIKPDEYMERVIELVNRIAHNLMGGLDITVEFKSWDSSYSAIYGNKTLTFNVKTCGRDFFLDPTDTRLLALIIHELCHEYGHHTEKAYLNAICKMGAQLTFLALTQKSFFDI